MPRCRLVNRNCANVRSGVIAWSGRVGRRTDIPLTGSGCSTTCAYSYRGLGLMEEETLGIDIIGHRTLTSARLINISLAASAAV